jgi:predicted LPLAT superfamily acyltransferase
MTLKDILTPHWDMLIGRVGGRMTFRLVMQPLVASFFAVRAGLKDAREGRPPYIWSVYFHPGKRRDLFREGWRDVSKVFLVAVALDVIYEIIEFRWVYPGQAVIVAIILAIVPYLLVRGPVNRLASKTAKFRNDEAAELADGGVAPLKSESQKP